jgi:hypothetical protein
MPMKNAGSYVLALAMLATAAPGDAQDRTTDPLRGVAHCFDTGEFKVKTRDRLPATSTSRMINTSAGPAPVSTADGYRLMVYRASAEPLVNLKIEQSAPGTFDADREAVMGQLAALSARATPANSVPLATSTQHGIDIAALDNPGIGTAGVISMVQLFDAATGTIATAYILNQSPRVREYADKAAYDALRNCFVTAHASCMAQARQ